MDMATDPATPNHVSRCGGRFVQRQITVIYTTEIDLDFHVVQTGFSRGLFKRPEFSSRLDHYICMYHFFPPLVFVRDFC